jgi:ketosteroid isomerase-like protein
MFKRESQNDRVCPCWSRTIAVLLTLLVLAIPRPLSAADDTAEAGIKAALAQWTTDFNAGRADRVCSLFSTDLRANVRGAAERDYAALCDLLTRSLGDRSRSYSYALDLKEIKVWGNNAMVRLVWTLTVRQGDKVTTSVEPGMDIFERQGDGSWKIIRFMAYEQ